MRNKILFVIVIVQFIIIIALGIIAIPKNEKEESIKCPTENKYICTKIDKDYTTDPKLVYEIILTVDKDGILTNQESKVEYRYATRETYQSRKDARPNEEGVTYNDEKMVATIKLDWNFGGTKENPAVYYYARRSLENDGYQCNIVE